MGAHRFGRRRRAGRVHPGHRAVHRRAWFAILAPVGVAVAACAAGAVVLLDLLPEAPSAVRASILLEAAVTLWWLWCLASKAFDRPTPWARLRGGWMWGRGDVEAACRRLVRDAPKASRLFDALVTDRPELIHWIPRSAAAPHGDR